MENNYFLAVCKDHPNAPDGFCYTVYFVNNTANEIESLSYETYGFVTFDDEFIKTSTHQKELGKVSPFSSIEIEKDDEGSFDFVINFEFKLKLIDRETENLSFTIGKYMSGGKEVSEPLPILEKVGYMFDTR
jgi:hypothetical protein